MVRHRERGSIRQLGWALSNRAVDPLGGTSIFRDGVAMGSDTTRKFAQTA
jgi:hypothetical protein